MKSEQSSLSPHLSWSHRTGGHELCFWILSFKSAFSLSPLTFIKKFFRSSSLSAIRMLSSAYLWVLIFLPAVLIPACESTSLAFCHDVLNIEVNYTEWQYTALTYTFPSLEPVCYSMPGSNCCFLSCIQVSRETGQVVWYSHLFKNFPVYCDPHSQSH